MSVIVDGAAVKARRLQLGLTREKLVDGRGVGLSTIKRIERAKVPTARAYNTAKQIASALSVNMQEILAVDRTLVIEIEDDQIEVHLNSKMKSEEFKDILSGYKDLTESFNRKLNKLKDKYME